MKNKWIRRKKNDECLARLKSKIGQQCAEYYEGGKIGDYSAGHILTGVHQYGETDEYDGIVLEVDGKFVTGWWVWMCFKDE